MKKTTPIKTIYYSDEHNDDFSVTKELKSKKINKTYNYFREKNFFVKLFSFFLYYIFAKPVVYIVLKLLFHIKFINKKALRKRGKKGCLIYSNHTNYLPDASVNSLLHSGRNYIIVSSPVVNIKGLQKIVQDLGAIPLGDSYEAKRNFIKCINQNLKRNASITIYPEAHIWPYCNFVRNFKADSFRYALNKDIPIFTSAICYQKRKNSIKPKIVVKVDGPFYIDHNLDNFTALQKIRDDVFAALDSATKEYSTYEYYKYIKKK